MFCFSSVYFIISCLHQLICSSKVIYTADYLCILLRKYNVTNHSNNCNTKSIVMQCLTERHHYQPILLLLQEVIYCNVNTCMHSNINFSVHIIFISWIIQVHSIKMVNKSCIFSIKNVAHFCIHSQTTCRWHCYSYFDICMISKNNFQ